MITELLAVYVVLESGRTAEEFCYEKEDEFTEGRMDIEKIVTVIVAFDEAKEVNFIEDDTVRIGDIAASDKEADGEEKRNNSGLWKGGNIRGNCWEECKMSTSGLGGGVRIGEGT